ncbi:MFS monocarboxylate transporter [Penicillium sp. IBT 16267x]|nr:MFS monocarboxylate transporter [Penicillium sp. IBT 16267x]
MAVLACWCVMFNTFGYINAFGIYEAYYKEKFLHNQTESNIAWIGLIQTFFMLSAGLVSGPLMDRSGPKVKPEVKGLVTNLLTPIIITP